MPRIRKDRAGSDSFGNTWPEDGAVVDVDPEHAAALLAIPDGGFTEVTPTADKDDKELSEVDPSSPGGEPNTKPPAKKTAARKTAASKVEE